MKRVFMAVTNDKYELPLMVCDTLKELAKKLGITYTMATKYIYRDKTRTTYERNSKRYYKLISVKIDNEE